LFVFFSFHLLLFSSLYLGLDEVVEVVHNADLDMEGDEEEED